MKAAFPTLVLFTVFLVASGDATAHGSPYFNGPQCLFKIGPDKIAFNGYQPEKSRDIFCETAPAFGKTIIALDFQQDELREMDVDVRVLRDVWQIPFAENQESNTEAYLPAKRYIRGTINLEHDFARPWRFALRQGYVMLVKARSPDGQKVYVGRFPFEIDESTPVKEALAPWLRDLSVVAALILGCVFWRRRRARRKQAAS